MPRLKAELSRQCRRLAGTIDDIAEVEAEMKGRVRRIAIVAMARKLAVALWRYLRLA